MMRNVNNIIFDLDGTLIDSKEEVLETYQKVFELMPPADVASAFDIMDYSATLSNNLIKIYSGNTEKATRAKVLFTKIYDSSDYVKTDLYPDVFEGLNNFFEQGFNLFIATNKRLLPTERILKAKNIHSLFTRIISTDSIENTILSKEKMVSLICEEHNIKSGYMVGDSSGDLDAGKKAGLLNIAALYGYEKKENLLKNNPNFVINNFKEINKIIIENHE